MNFLILSVLLCLGISIALGGLLDLQVLDVPNLLFKAAEHPSNVFLVMNQPTLPVLNRIQLADFPDEISRATEMRTQLVQLTTASQALLLAACKLFGVEAEGFWITNQIFVKGVTATFLAILETLLAAGLFKEIRADITFPVLPDTVNPVIPNPPNNSTPRQWNVDQTLGDPNLWSRANGTGVLFGIIDTGVNEMHEAIRSKYIGSTYPGWYDPLRFNLTTPTDENGHGTHCTGIVCGDFGIGVAPGAKWMACRGCNSVNCMGNNLIACGQFMACPQCPTVGNCTTNDGRCKPPRIVTNSWGGGQGDMWFNDVIKAWTTVGIIPVFAIGNSGSNCNTANSPGDQDDVIGVGSTNQNSSVSSFSSRGPALFNGGLKPDCAAPGGSILSAYIPATNSYRVLSGTSMATPHVTGSIALFLSANPGVKFSRTDVESKFFPKTFRGLTPTGQNCGGMNDTLYPNNNVGYGRIDCSFI